MPLYIDGRLQPDVGGGGGGAVSSVFGRTGAVVAVAGDYDHSEIGAVGPDDHHARDHAATHSDGGADEVEVQNLASGSSDTGQRLRPDGAGGLEFVDEDDITDFDGGTDSTSGTTELTKVSITIPAEDATFIIEAGALISMSNTTANGEVRVQNTTDAATLGRAYNKEVADSENVVSAVFKREFVQTAAAGAKTIALQYSIASGTGTISISDAFIRARRVVA